MTDTEEQQHLDRPRANGGVILDHNERGSLRAAIDAALADADGESRPYSIVGIAAAVEEMINKREAENEGWMASRASVPLPGPWVHGDSTPCFGYQNNRPFAPNGEPWDCEHGQKVRPASAAIPLRFAQHLASYVIGGPCAIYVDEKVGECGRRAVGIRWEDGFADDVCDVHAALAAQRGAVVVTPRQHGGGTGL